MYNQQYSQIYDLLHADKAYSSEVDFIYGMYNTHSVIELQNILDVGCGTGNHLKHMSKEDVNILGVDPSAEMINIAREKQIKNTEFMVGDISKLTLMETYEMVTSLFNVVNHINNLKDLKAFFRTIYYRVSYGGVFIFDCLNGIAATRDAPQDRYMEKEIDGSVVKIDSRCENDLFKSQFTMYNSMIWGNQKIQYSLKQTLWPPKILIDMLEDIGFEICKIYKAFDKEKEASLDDYKIVFIVKKIIRS